MYNVDEAKQLLQEREWSMITSCVREALGSWHGIASSHPGLQLGNAVVMRLCVRAICMYTYSERGRVCVGVSVCVV